MSTVSGNVSQKIGKPPKHPSTGKKSVIKSPKRFIDALEYKENLNNENVPYYSKNIGASPIKSKTKRQSSNASTDDDERSTFNQKNKICYKENNKFNQNIDTVSKKSTINETLSIILSNNDNDKPFISKYKTEICVPFSIYGICKYGSSCAYAHGEQELRPKINLSENYKTKLCKQFSETQQCQYGDRCWFIHSRCISDMNPSYSLILTENCNLVYQKELTLGQVEVPYLSIVKTQRLPIFQKITAF